VGERVQDKYGAMIGPFIVNRGNALLYDRDISMGDFFNWLIHGKGVFKSSLAEGTWAMTTNSAKRDGRTEAPNIHTYILSVAVSKELESGATKSFNVKPAVAKFLSRTKGKDSFMQLVTLNKPVGHGWIKLRDADPYSPLLIDPKYLENPKDFEDLVQGKVSLI